MKQFSRILIATAASMASMTTMAQSANAPTFQVKIQGVIKPGSCKPENAGGLVYNLKQINAKSLKEAGETLLPVAAQKLSITCDSDTAIALSATENTTAAAARNSSLSHTLANVYATQPYVYSLVEATTDERVGDFAYQFRNFTYQASGSTGSSKQAKVITSADKVNWKSSENNAWDAAQLKKDGTTFISFSDPATPTAPVLASRFEGEVVVSASIRPKNELKLVGDLAFEGGSTITISYL